MTEKANLYGLGFADGRQSMVNEILAAITEEQHLEDCTCDPCFVVHTVLEQYLDTIRQMLGEGGFHEMANDLAVAAGEDPRPVSG